MNLFFQFQTIDNSYQVEFYNSYQVKFSKLNNFRSESYTIGQSEGSGQRVKKGRNTEI